MVYGMSHNTGKRGAAETVRPIGMNQSTGKKLFYSTFPVFLLVPKKEKSQNGNRIFCRKNYIVFHGFFCVIMRKRAAFAVQREGDRYGRSENR